MIYDRLHTREIARYGGLADNMPGYALLFMLFTMASVGLPGTSGFVGEFLSLVGTYQASSWGAIVAHHRHHPRRRLHAVSLLARRLRRCSATPMPRRCPTSSRANGGCSRPIAAAVLWMGVYPESFLRPMRGDIGRLLVAARARRARRRFAPHRRQGRRSSRRTIREDALMGRFAPLSCPS